jgi:hypothetical protein
LNVGLNIDGAGAKVNDSSQSCTNGPNDTFHCSIALPYIAPGSNSQVTLVVLPRSNYTLTASVTSDEQDAKPSNNHVTFAGPQHADVPFTGSFLFLLAVSLAAVAALRMR